jgi:hypothetical protein
MSSHVPFEPLPGSNGQPTATVRHGGTARVQPALDTGRARPARTTPPPLWTLAWQPRAAAWMLRHRPIRERSTTGLPATLG